MRKGTTLVTAVGGLALMAFFLTRSCGSQPGGAGKRASASANEDLSVGLAGTSRVQKPDRMSDNGAGNRSRNATKLAFFSPWGGGEKDLGRDQPGEGSPSGPMSFTVDSRGRVWVLDQVNGRIVRFKNGEIDGALPLDRPRAQDIAIGEDGT